MATTLVILMELLVATTLVIPKVRLVDTTLVMLKVKPLVMKKVPPVDMNQATAMVQLLVTNSVTTKVKQGD